MEVASTDLLWRSDRERILQASAELCASQGFEETTVEQVIERAGVERDVFAAIFGDLESCLVAVVNALLGEVVSVIATASSPKGTEWEGGLRGMRATLELMAAHPSFAYLAFIGARQMATPAVRAVSEARSDVITAMLERLWEYSESEVQPSRAARAALGGAEALVRREIAAGRIEQLPRLLPEFAYGTTAPFLGQKRALALAVRAREMLAGTVWE
jgi:AcrR family transcriptional regulator